MVSLLFPTFLMNFLGPKAVFMNVKRELSVADFQKLTCRGLADPSDRRNSRPKITLIFTL